MSVSKASVKRQFSEKACTYDRYAQVQKEMAHLLIEQAAAMPAVPDEILEIGIGTGYVSGMMLERYPAARYKGLDIAPGMVEEVRKRFAVHQRRCEWILADVEEWAPGAGEHSFDMIVSNACFQWLHRPAETFDHLHRLLRPGGQFVFTTFGPRTFAELHASFSAAYATLEKPPARHGLSFRPLSEWGQMMKTAGFHSVTVFKMERVFIFPSVRDFLHSVKAIGASTTQADSGNGLGQRRLMTEMMQQYENGFRTPQGIPATYEIIVAAGCRS